MALTVIVTRDVLDRTRGFLGSVMLEVAVGVYVSPKMTPAVRERLTSVLNEWHQAEPTGGIVIVWRDIDLPGGVGVKQIGEATRELVELDGLLLVRRASRHD